MSLDPALANLLTAVTMANDAAPAIVDENERSHTMKSPRCPSCATEFVKRARREGVHEKLLGVCYVYPFRCQLCGHRFRLLQWGVTYIRVDHDARAFERLPVNLFVAFASDGVDGQGHVIDVSMAGCSIQTDTPLRVGEIVRLSLKLSDDAPPLEIAAALVRNVQSDRKGIEFLTMQFVERKRLESFIEQLLIVRANAKGGNRRFANHDSVSHLRLVLSPRRVIH